ncbi:site-2 protease family protein [Sphingomonas sp. AR_OL41]|uniref:site-2 protease family protein n=1 Tax=Sphingomonas sp. AR_OL41 TaxID=3042729 RepID=UPI002480C2E8|nr:site-2 protease family protein [Sphingomonas sp. AR_OL41]MDH7975860.1 site-2 protease family protein [Sphingomonas sp. AR_OL41]
MNPDNVVYQVAAWVIPLIIAIVFHEVAHGYVAYLLGDRTAQRLGRLTLNPIRHVDPIGTVVLPLVLALAHAPIFGWAKPVPVIASRMRNPQLDMALVAMAGPASNLVLGFVAALGVALVSRAAGAELPETGVTYFLLLNLYNFLQINIFLSIFNMLPLPPFDGGHVVAAVLPKSLAAPYAQLGRYGFLIMLGLLVILPTIAPGADVVAQIIGPVADGVRRLFLGVAGLLV